MNTLPANAVPMKQYEQHMIRTHWDETEEKWYFSIVDVVQVLTDSVDGRKYWNKLKQRLKAEGNQTVTNCHQLKMPAADGKMRKTDVADVEQLLCQKARSRSDCCVLRPDKVPGGTAVTGCPHFAFRARYYKPLCWIFYGEKPMQLVYYSQGWKTPSE